MKNIFVGNLSFGATEDAVRSLFEPYGTVERVNLITDRDTGQARGFRIRRNERERGCRSRDRGTERQGTGRPSAERERSASEDGAWIRRRRRWRQRQRSNNRW